MKRIIVSFLFVFLFSSFCFGQEFLGGKLELSGFFKNETATKFNDPNDFMKIKNTMDLEARYKIKENIYFFTHFRKWYDYVFAEESKYHRLKHDMWTNRRFFDGISWLRECYLDIYSDVIDIRIGKQQVTWGTADGIKILDQVDPYDNREFNLEDWADSRIPLWKLKIEYAPTINGSLQFLFIPDFEPHFLAKAGSPFAYRATNIAESSFDRLKNMQIAGVPLNYRLIFSEKRPKQSFRDAKFGLRWRDVVGNFEYTINWLHGYDMYAKTHTYLSPTVDMQTILTLSQRLFPNDPAALQKTIDFFRQNHIPPPGTTFRFVKKYYQTELFGASFTKQITKGYLKGLTIRGEFAATKNVGATYYKKEGGTGVARIDTYNYVIGLDKYLITNWFFSFQFIQLINSPYKRDGQKFLNPAGGTQDHVETILSLKVSTDFWNERIKPDILILYGDDNDWEIRPKVHFEYNDYLVFTFGANLFAGPSKQLFGEFNKNNEFYTEVKIGF